MASSRTSAGQSDVGSEPSGGHTIDSNREWRSARNTGLVNAFSQVGQNLFGEAVFDAVVVPPNPVTPAAAQIDVALDSQIPAALGEFVSPNPARRRPA